MTDKKARKEHVGGEVLALSGKGGREYVKNRKITHYPARRWEVTVDSSNHITVKGPKGTLERDLVPQMKVEVDGNVVKVSRPDDDKKNRPFTGLRERS